MRKLLLAAAVYAGLLCSVAAQVGMGGMFPGPGTVHSAGGGGYTGPGDVQAFAAWGGMRAYSAAKRGTKAINLCDNAGANCSDVLTDATTGLLSPPGTHGANNCNTSDTCLIKTVYDQVGTNNWTETTTSFMPPLVHNTLNTSFGISCTGGTTIKLRATASYGYAQPYAVSIVAKRTSNVTNFSTAFSGDDTGTPQIGFSNAANNALLFAGSVVSVTSVADNSFHSINTSMNGASTIYNIDGATATVSPGTTTMGGTVGAICQTGVDTNNLTGFIMEVGVLNAGLVAGVLSSLNTNAHAAYGSW